jgi:hypothetical protein
LNSMDFCQCCVYHHTGKVRADKCKMMSHPKNKKRRFTDQMTVVASAGDLSNELLANILGFLDGPKDIMQKRRVCKKWKEAVKITIVPLTDFRVGSVEKYNDVVVMPNLQQITLTTLGSVGHKYADGEDTFDFSAFFPFNPPFGNYIQL